MMKILHVLPTLSAGGAESFIARLCCELQTKGLAEVVLFVPGGVRDSRGAVLYRQLKDAGVQVYGYESKSMRSFSHLANLVRLIFVHRPDVVQANLFAADVLCWVVRFFFLFSRIHFVRRLANTSIPAFDRPWLAKFLHSGFDGVIYCSLATEVSYSSFIKGLGENKVVRTVTIENGVVVPDELPDRTCSRSRFLIENDSFVICHVGRFTAGDCAESGGLASGQKAHDTIIRSFAAALENGLQKNSILLLLGAGPLMEEAEQLVKNLGIFEQVRFLGLLPDTWEALAASDVFFFPSRHEGLPNALVEAACCGLPVVASNIPEIVNINLDDGWLLSDVDDVGRFAESLVFSSRNIDKLKAKATTGADKFKRAFSIQACAQSYRAFYSSLSSRVKVLPKRGRTGNPE